MRARITPALGGNFGGRVSRRLVGEVRAEPLLGLGDRYALAHGIVLDLVACDPPDGEVPRRRVAQVDAADACRGPHREALGERDADILCAEQLEQLRLLAVVGAP